MGRAGESSRRRKKEGRDAGRRTDRLMEEEGRLSRADLTLMAAEEVPGRA